MEQEEVKLDSREEGKENGAKCEGIRVGRKVGSKERQQATV